MIGSIPMEGSQDFSATFDQAVGAKTIRALVQGKSVTLLIPTGTTSDGGGAPIAAPAASIPAHLRPAADHSLCAIVTNNNAKVFGKLVIGSNGSISFTTSAAGGNFTDNAVAGFDAVAVTYPVA